MVASNSAVVLIVEDEPLIRFNILDVLEDVGHVALEAANADEALVVLKGRQDVDILFTDVNMAGSMDGIQLAKRVRAMRPNIGIIITSGWCGSIRWRCPPTLPSCQSPICTTR